MTTRNHNEWVVATVEDIVVETPLVKSFFFKMPYPLTHLAGQHYELRLTAENGYQAARLYSAATPGDEGTLLQLTIMDVADGEVSPYLSQQLQVGDKVEVRGPFGKFFVWSPENTRPVVLIGGGTGVVPMHSMLVAHDEASTAAPMRLLYSTRHYNDILYKDTFLHSRDTTITLTQEMPASWPGKTGRINKEMVREVIDGLDAPLCYLCGMSPFVDAASSILIDLGIPPTDILTERFG